MNGRQSKVRNRVRAAIDAAMIELGAPTRAEVGAARRERNADFSKFGFIGQAKRKRIQRNRARA